MTRPVVSYLSIYQESMSVVAFERKDGDEFNCLCHWRRLRDAFLAFA